MLPVPCVWRGSVTRYSRRFVLRTLVAALPVTLIACGQPAPAAPSKPAESQPALGAAAPTQAAAPRG